MTRWIVALLLAASAAISFAQQTGGGGAGAGGGGGNLPSAPSIGAVPTATAAGTTYTGQIPLGGSTWYYPVEWYGAVGDATGAAGVGTDNTTAIQACLTAVAAAGKGQCLLQAKKYRITAALTIGATSVGIAGTSYGAWSTAISNQLSASAPVSALVIDSATADAVDAAGASINAPISFNKFNDFTIIRTVAATAAGSGCGAGNGPAGLSVKFAGGFTIDRVWSEDSACNFFFLNAGAYGTGYMQNSGSMWGANGFNPGISVYGIFYNGAQSAESFRLRNSFSQTLYPGFSGVQSTGLLVTGADLNDIFVSGFETAFQTYGEYIQYISGGGAVTSSDIHLIDCVNDSFFQDGIVISGLATANGSTVEIKGGWDSTSQTGTAVANTSAGINIINSSGVSVSAVQFLGIFGVNNQKYGILTSGSSRLTISGNEFLNMGNAAIALGTTTDSTVSANSIAATAGSTSTGIQGASLTRTAITGNSLSGTATFGIWLDASSANNVVTGVAAIDPTSITTQVFNSGSNNTFDGVGGLIAKITGSGTPTSLTFSSIPQTYQNLKLVGNFVLTGGANLAMRFNGDSTAAHYAYGLAYQQNTATGAVQSNSATQDIVGANDGSVSVEIPSYTAGVGGRVTFNGQFAGFFVIGSSTESGNTGGIWTGTDVTSLTLADTGGTATFTTPSVFSLYGLN